MLMKKSKTLTVKTLTPENSPWARALKMLKAKSLLADSKHKIPKVEAEPVLPAAVVAAPVAKLTDEQLAASVAKLTDEQLAACVHLDYVTKQEIRDEFRTEAAYLAFIKAKKEGRVRFHGPQYRAKTGK
jgi:hypothetical protein